MTAETVVVRDDTPADELIFALANLNRHSKRAQCIVGTLEHPSEWDIRSARCDAVLADLLDSDREHLPRRTA